MAINGQFCTSWAFDRICSGFSETILNCAIKNPRSQTVVSPYLFQTWFLGTDLNITNHTVTQPDTYGSGGGESAYTFCG